MIDGDPSRFREIYCIYSDDLVGATAVISTLTAFEKKGKVDAFLY